MPDIEIIGGGSVVGFHPCTEAAREWIDENLPSEPWQWMGEVLYVEARYAGPIIVGAQEDGLEIQ